MRETWLGTSVLKASFGDSRLDQDLRSFALSLWHEQVEQGLARSNRGAWHSRYLDGHASIFSELVQRVKEVSEIFLQRWGARRGTLTQIHVAALWVNIHEAGNYNVEHQHAEDGASGDDIPLLSGVYYPDGPRSAAKLHFQCDQAPCSLEPAAGSLIIFPATLPHRVEASQSLEPRVSIAFNLIARSASRALHQAALMGRSLEPQHLPSLESLEAMEHGFTALHLASEAGHLEIMEQLLQQRADVFRYSAQGSLAVHLAAEAGQALAVKALLKAEPLLVNATRGQNRTVLHAAAANGQVDLLQHLLELGAHFQDGDTPLHMAVQNGHLAATELLLTRAPSLALRDSSGLLPAHEAARGGYEQILRALLKVAAVSGLGHWAVHGGHTAILDFLEQYEPQIFHQEPWKGPGSSAKEEAMANYLAAALIGAGSNPQVKTEDLSLMHEAAMAGHVAVAVWLQQRGLSSQPASSSQWLPIHLGASAGHVDVVRWLGQFDASARGRITPLHMAALNGHSKVAQSLLAMRASLRAAATDGSQPLHVAAASGHMEVAQLLLRSRAELHAETRKKQLPVHRAAEAGHGSMVQLLRHEL